MHGRVLLTPREWRASSAELRQEPPRSRPLQDTLLFFL